MATIGCKSCIGWRASTTSRGAPPARSFQQPLPAPLRSLLLSSHAQLSSWDDSKINTRELRQSQVQTRSSTALPKRQIVRMGNKATGGPFAPLVVVVRNIVGEKQFNQLRGKAIALHSQVIKDFCKILAVNNKQVQGVIRLAKKNGEKLGFLA